jgi:hypothetical protein
MLLRLTPSFSEVAAACFPVPGCRVYGYACKGGYRLAIYPPPPFTGPASYAGTGRTCYEALAEAVQLFHESAHAFPGARPLAAANAYAGTPNPTDLF